MIRWNVPPNTMSGSIAPNGTTLNSVALQQGPVLALLLMPSATVRLQCLHQCVREMW